jgi:hypothetical protein
MQAQFVVFVTISYFSFCGLSILLPNIYSSDERSWLSSDMKKLVFYDELFHWRREQDLNLRESCDSTRFPSVRLKPLGHLSSPTLARMPASWRAKTSFARPTSCLTAASPLKIPNSRLRSLVWNFGSNAIHRVRYSSAFGLGAWGG